MHKISPSAYKATIFSKTLDRDLDYWIEEEEIYPELSVKENHFESLVVDEVIKHFENLGE